MNKKMKVFSLGLGLIGFAIIMAPQSAKAIQGACVNCHTMHNMQGGALVDAGGPYNSLLNSPGDCVGCHTGTNGAATTTPFVLDTAGPPTASSLAGGNFYWVDQIGGDNKGHNVVGISGQDAVITVNPLTPPGWNDGFNANGQVAVLGATWGSQLTCAGTYGCHGLHTIASDFPALSGAHHANTAIDGSTPGKSFRFLQGILGYEDPAWEFAPTAAVHNQYQGFLRTGDLNNAAGKESINYFCAECHGNFHSGAGNLGASAVDTSIVTPWIRHPTDIDMNARAGEYLAYGGAVAHAYVPLTPVASIVATAPLATVAGAGNAIVSCISCHRAHGSEFDDLLRWNYGNCSAGSNDVPPAECGCFECHTTKDAG